MLVAICVNNRCAQMIMFKYYIIIITVLFSSSFPLGFPFRACHNKSPPSIYPCLCPLSQHGLYLGFRPGSSNLSILPPIYSLPILCMCLNPFSLNPKHLTCAVLLMYSFLTRSILAKDPFLHLFQPACTTLFPTLCCFGLLTLST